jgi:hypothetical protein
MGAENFLREGRALLASLGARVPPALRGAVGAAPPAPTPAAAARQAALAALTLDADAIWARERARPPVRAPWVIKGEPGGASLAPSKMRGKKRTQNPPARPLNPHPSLKPQAPTTPSAGRWT